MVFLLFKIAWRRPAGKEKPPLREERGLFEHLICFDDDQPEPPATPPGNVPTPTATSASAAAARRACTRMADIFKALVITSKLVAVLAS
jgi:hypothetical protein